MHLFKTYIRVSLTENLTGQLNAGRVCRHDDMWRLMLERMRKYIEYWRALRLKDMVQDKRKAKGRNLDGIGRTE